MRHFVSDSTYQYLLYASRHPFAVAYHTLESIFLAIILIVYIIVISILVAVDYLFGYWED